MPREWRDFTAAKGHRGSDDKVTDLTGWPPDVLSVMWNAYEAILPVTNARRPHSKQAYFFLAYRYIKLGPKVRELYSVLHTPYTGHVGKKAFYKHIVPIIIALGENVDMIRWGTTGWLGTTTASCSLLVLPASSTASPSEFKHPASTQRASIFINPSMGSVFSKCSWSSV